ncbi:TIP-1 family-domain-containing protein [Mycena olivaceomarginata]|nr:TIP-1 family-domain-containing protein [Mycena olivaceomarginata]
MSDGDSESTLLEDIETLHRNLKELQSVKGYVQVIEHALKLRFAPPPPLQPFSSASVTEYQSLQEFVSKVSDACAGVEDATGKQTLNLVLFWRKFGTRSLSSSLLVASERLGWPMPVDYLAAAPQDRKDFERTFSDLLKLQNIGEKLRPPNLKERSEKDGLYPLQALIQPISQRFKYHFEGTRQTNRTDKPEWYFTHVLNVMHEHRPFMEAVIQPLLSATENRGIVAWSSRNTIYQALVFDAAVAESGLGWRGTSAAASEKWNGVSDVILGKEEWFAAWMDGRSSFAEDQYHEIISAVDAWHIADEEGEGNEEASHLRELRSTNSARRLKALVEQITDRYSPLPHFAHRTRFLINVQIPILENYYGRILASLDAFETLSSAFVRAVPGALAVSLGRDDGSVKGVQRLCKAWLSARYVEAAMEGWGEELFFLELWTEITVERPFAHRRWPLPLYPIPAPRESAVPQETVIGSLCNRAEDMIVAQVCGEVEGGCEGPLRSDHISVMTALYRRIAARLAEHILQRQILYRGHITALEGRRSRGAGLGGALIGGRNRVEAPWLVGLEGEEQTETSELPREEVQRILKSRDD